MAIPNEHNENELLRLVAAGEEQAFQQLFVKYGNIIKAIGIKLVQNDALADDVVQDVFLRVWINRDKLPGSEHFKAWLFQITYYHCFNLLRRQKTKAKADKELSMHAGSGAVTEETVQFLETQRMVRLAISSLPPQTKLIYQLSREQGLNIQEIAGQLQLSPQTVKNTLVRALKMIREHLQECGYFMSCFLLQKIFF